MIRFLAGCSGAIVMLGWAVAVQAEPRVERPYPCPTICAPNAGNFGYFPTMWRRWPTVPAPEETNPRAVGAEVLPTPAGQGFPPPRVAPPPQPPVMMPEGTAIPPKATIPPPVPPPATNTPIAPPQEPESLPAEQPASVEPVSVTPVTPSTPLMESMLLGRSESHPSSLPSVWANEQAKERVPPGAPTTPLETLPPLGSFATPFISESPRDAGPAQGFANSPDTSLSLLSGGPSQDAAKEAAPVQAQTKPQEALSPLPPLAPMSSGELGEDISNLRAQTKPQGILSPLPPLSPLPKDNRSFATAAPSMSEPASKPAESCAPTITPNREVVSLVVDAGPQQREESSYESRAHLIAETVEPASSRVESAGYATAELVPPSKVADSIAVPTIALNGYCVVELTGNGRWVPGDVRWTAVHKGCTYRFSGETQWQQFLSNPDAFAPANSGNDAVLTVDQNRMTPGQSAFCATYNGRLYMFASAATQARFNQTPQRYAEMK